MQIMISVRYHFTLTGGAMVRKKDNEDVEKSEHLYTPGGNAKWHIPCGKPQCLAVPQKVKENYCMIWHSHSWA